MNTHQTPSRPGKIIAGLIVITVGTIFLMRQLGYPFPTWIFTWPMILIVIGLINGAKRGFRNFGWLVLVGLGVAFLLDHMYPIYHVTRYAWPMLIIAAGLFMIFGRNRSWREHAESCEPFHGRRTRWSPSEKFKPGVNPVDVNYTQNTPEAGDPIHTTTSTQGITPEFIDINAVLGGIKRTIFSKNVTGADINAFMRGAELNFSQADIQGRVIMDINLVMGGCKLIVPSNWEVLSEITTILGGVDDKRMMAPTFNTSHPKILVLKGTAFMGGIEIQSYI